MNEVAWAVLLLFEILLQFDEGVPLEVVLFVDAVEVVPRHI